ncbi:MAG TPA: YkgJ family cysteine cluster protein, partial [bacterium]|nr:YkgJ family cysteine cluster protein [bacterium]
MKTDKFEFSCQTCGNCCAGDSGYVWLSEEEQLKISKFLDLPLNEFLKKYTKKINGRITLKELRKSENDYWCIFLDKRRKCKIYECRPLQCRNYPYWQNLLNDDELLKIHSTICKGMILNDKN